MEKKHIITLCGDLGSGKGAVSTALAETLGYEIYRNGWKKFRNEYYWI